MLRPVVFNGKFYAGGLNGVHRVADRLIRGVDLYDIPVGSAGGGRIKVRLMRVKAGVAVPQHTHEGIEMTLVLAGAVLTVGSVGWTAGSWLQSRPYAK